MQKIIEEIITTENFDAHQDWEVPIPGFVIIASKDKTKKSLAEFDDREVTELILLTKRVREAMKEKLNIEIVYLFQNEDSEHGFHVWMFPRYEWMDKFGKKIQSVRTIMEYAKEHLLSPDKLLKVKSDAKLLKEYLCQN